MKIFSNSSKLASLIYIALLLGACATPATEEQGTVVGAKIGGVEGMLPNTTHTTNGVSNAPVNK